MIENKEIDEYEEAVELTLQTYKDLFNLNVSPFCENAKKISDKFFEKVCGFVLAISFQIAELYKIAIPIPVIYLRDIDGLQAVNILYKAKQDDVNCKIMSVEIFDNSDEFTFFIDDENNNYITGKMNLKTIRLAPFMMWYL